MNFANKDGVIYLDGKSIPWREANTHLLNHTLHYGVGVFEGLRCYSGPDGPAVFRLREHMQRLKDSAKIIMMPFQTDLDTCCQVVIDNVKANAVTHGYIRPMVFFGSEEMGLHSQGLTPHFMCASWNWGDVIPGSDMGLRVMTSSIRRVHINSSFVKAKINGNYINSSLALREAERHGYHDALLLDHQGFVAEGSAANFFYVKSGVVYTPPLSSVLAGITRASIIRLLQDMEIPVIEKHFAIDEVYIADEAFFTGTAMEVKPITEVDNRPLGNGQVGSLTNMIRETYRAVVSGEHPRYQHWLTKV